MPTPSRTRKPPNPRGKKYRVRIRMYRQGLGDCFLLSFARKKGKDFHMLIDCGVVLGTSEPGVVMKLIAEDVKAQTRGQIDVLVITHEHWDHLSGFDSNQARAVYANMEIKALWLAWTEDDKDDLANRLREERERKKQAAQAAAKAAKSRRRNREARRLTELLGLFGAQAAGEDDGADDAGGGTAGALKFLKGKCSPTILQTETSRPMPGLDGVRVYVLGPPKDEKALRQTTPAKSEGYGLVEAPIGLADAFLAAFDPSDERAQPFIPALRHPLSELNGRASERPAEGQSGIYAYYARGREWRNIDDDWLATGERLALQLDSATNNTSLVLAIELPGNDVLLFVGDAQAGNWRSWEPRKWPLKGEDGETRTVTTADLLEHTIFYKVGHHGSHNATLREKGLRLMKSERLAALIPVDTKVAHTVKGWTHMPLPAIREALENQCALIFQSDIATIEKRKVPGTWWEDSAKKFDVRMLNKKTKKMETVRRESLYTDYFV